MHPKSIMLSCRCTEQERQLFEQAAGKFNRTISSWMRERLKQAALQDLNPVCRPLPRVVVDMNGSFQTVL